MVSIKRALLGVVSIAAVSFGFAQVGFVDVHTNIHNDNVSYKLKAGKNGKPGQIQMSFQAFTTYFNATIFTPKEILKAKATGSFSIYLSNDSELSPADQLLLTKKFNVKMVKPKLTKIKLNLTEADNGKYVLIITDSPQDQYFSNDTVVHRINTL